MDNAPLRKKTEASGKREAGSLGLDSDLGDNGGAEFR